MKTAKHWTPCARCLKRVESGKEKHLQLVDGQFVQVQDMKADVWVFGPDCYRIIVRNGGRRDW